jgi:hypothetical protein
MLRLQTPTSETRSERRTPSALLGVTWVHGRLRAARIGAEGEPSWTASGLVRTEAELANSLREAVAALGSGLQKVVFLLAHSNLVPLHLDLPMASPARLRQLLPREVERQKPFPEPALWWEQREAVSQKSGARPLHLLAKSVHDGISRACAQVGLKLESVIPVSEAIRSLDSAASVDGSIVLRAVVLPEGLAIVASEGNSVLLVRSVRLSSLEPERVGQELRRTLTYLQEQVQRPVARIRLFHLGPDTVPGVLDLQVGVPLECPDLPDASWFEWLQKRSVASDIRWIGGTTRDSGRATGFGRWDRLGWILSGVSVLAVGVLEWNLGNTRDKWRFARNQRDTLEATVRTLEEVRAGHRQARELLGQWNRTRRSSLPVGLPALLGSELPASWVLHQMDLQTDSTGWTVRLEGGPGSPGVPFSEAELAGMLAKLTNSPWQPQLQSPNLTDRSSVVPTSRQSWSQRLQPTVPPSTVRRDRFELVLHVP